MHCNCNCFCLYLHFILYEIKRKDIIKGAVTKSVKTLLLPFLERSEV